MGRIFFLSLSLKRILINNIKKMEYQFEGICFLVLEHKEGEKSSKHVQTKLTLGVSKNLDRKEYIGKDDLPTKEGSRVLTDVFVQGLIANIHASNQKGFRNDAEHLRYIISELERGFVAIGEIGSSTL